jgi:hypothetical protein
MKRTLDDLLTEFFGERSRGVTGIKLRRVADLERRLRSHLEAEGARVLVDRDKAILEMERGLNPDGAFCRTMHGDDLIYALSGFLEASISTDPADVRLELATVGPLVNWLIDHGVDSYGMECPIYDLEGAVRRGRAALRDRTGVQSAARRP